MVLAIDIGNSSISCGVFRIPVPNADSNCAPVCAAHFKIASKNLSADEYLLIIHQFLFLHHIQPAVSLTESANSVNPQNTYGYADADILNACVISSVVPALTDAVSKAAHKLTGKTPFLIGQGIRTGFQIRIKQPEQLGADIVSNIAGAFLYHEQPFAVLDVGTATTITFVNCNKEVPGIIIMPGLTVSMEALSESAALLAQVPLEKSPELLGKNTSESVRSGVINGHALMIDGFLRNIRENYLEHGEKLGLIATGGLASAVLPCCMNKFRYIPDLTLIGAVQLYQKNRPHEAM